MPKPTKYRGAIIRPTPHGTYRAEYNRHPSRPRSSHPTIQAAKDWVDHLHQQLNVTGGQLDAATLAHAVQAATLLEGRATLLEAAQYWHKHHPKGRESITLPDLIQKYIDIRENDGLRDKSLITIRHKLRPLGKAHPTKTITQLTPDDLRPTQTGAPGTRNTTRRYYIMFWRWAIANGYAHENPAQALTIARADDPQPVALTLPQVRALLQAARDTDPDLLPRITIALFAGLRSGELARIGAQHIQGDRIHLDATITKTRDRRILDIAPNLQAWLQAYPPGPTLILTNHRKREDKIRAAAGLHPWPQNAMRHTFATYHLAAHQDPGKTAHYTRHENQQTLHRHYVDMATHADGLEYFEITPQSLPEH
jgi:integrase